jgi:hypothetical protein
VDGEGEMFEWAAGREGAAGRRRTERSMGAAGWEERRRRRGKEDAARLRSEQWCAARERLWLAQTLSFLQLQNYYLFDLVGFFYKYPTYW